MSGYVFGSPEFARSGCGCLVALVLVAVGAILVLEPDAALVSSRTPVRRPEPGCPGELLQACLRVATGEAPAKVFGTHDPEQILALLQACTLCAQAGR